MTRSQLLFGLVFVALGTVLLLDRAGLVDAGSVIGGWWPLVVVVAGLAQLVTRPRNPVGGGILALIGLALLLWTLDVVNVLRLVWPLLLITIGVWVLLGRGRRRHRDALQIDGGRVDLTTVFSDRRLRAPAGPLEGGSLITVFGDVDLDLRDAVVIGRAELQVSTVFGDLDLVVPDTWRVTVSGPELFGDVRVDGPRELPASAPVLHLRLVVVFGDVEVRAEPVGVVVPPPPPAR